MILHGASLAKVTLHVLYSLSDKNILLSPIICLEHPFSTYQWLPWFWAYKTTPHSSFLSTLFFFYVLGSWTCFVWGVVLVFCVQHPVSLCPKLLKEKNNYCFLEYSYEDLHICCLFYFRTNMIHFWYIYL